MLTKAAFKLGASFFYFTQKKDHLLQTDCSVLPDVVRTNDHLPAGLF